MASARKGWRDFVLISLTLFSATGTYAAEHMPPEITSQGFDIAQVQKGVVGDFQRIRIRFEVPDRIESLQVRERSFEVDLASTPERRNLSLFGLTRQVRQVTDVTLDFSTYINRKIHEAGDYVIELYVKDRRDRSASAALKISVSGKAPINSPEDRLDTGQFEFIRRGASAVTGADDFGIRWTTVEPNQVVVSITPAPDQPVKLLELDAAAYARLTNRGQLKRELETAPAAPSILLPTAADRAAGRVFGVMHERLAKVLMITSSQTVLTESGTTVTLTGEYKH